jgi:hypothetical protein
MLEDILCLTCLSLSRLGGRYMVSSLLLCHSGWVTMKSTEEMLITILSVCCRVRFRPLRQCL